jgi:TPR repeat protein
MKNIFYTIILSFLFSFVCLAGDLQVGWDAYNAGDYATAYKEWKPLAEQGDATAQNDLGLLYDKGTGVTQDYKKAVKWYRLSAKQGFFLGQYNLGLRYYLGEGVVQDYKEAAKWYRLAAEQGYVEAQFNLGLMYNNGLGVVQDYKEAMKWYWLAAEQRETKSQAKALYNLGMMYGMGEGVKKDLVITHMLFNLAALNKYKDALQGRDIAESKMTPEQIAEAKELAFECVKKNYKDCG